MAAVAIAVSVLAVLGLLADMLDRDHVLVLGGVEYDHALGGAAGDADVLDRAADELALVGDQHDLVGILHREGGDELAVAAVDAHGDDAFTAATGGAVLERRGPLAVAVLRDGQHELLGRRHLDIALLAELHGASGLLGVGPRLLFGAAAAHRIGPAQVGHAFLGVDVHVTQDRERDHLVVLGKR